MRLDADQDSNCKLDSGVANSGAIERSDLGRSDVMRKRCTEPPDPNGPSGSSRDARRYHDQISLCKTATAPGLLVFAFNVAGLG